MKFILHTLLLLGGLNLILARSIYWGPYHTHVNPWSNYDYDDELFALPSRQNSDEEKDFKKFVNNFDKSSEDSKESTEIKTSNELGEDDAIESLKATQLKEIESFLSVVLGYDSSEDDTKIDEKSKEKEDDNDDDNNENDNTAENNNDDTDNSQEQIPVNSKELSEEKKSLHENESKESNEKSTVKDTDKDDDVYERIFSHSQTNKFSGEELKEKDIGELIAVVWTISTMDDLMKLTGNTSENDELLTDEELKEKKLKEGNDYLRVFGSLWNKVLSEYLEKEIETEKLNNDDDSKDAEPDSESEGKKDNHDDGNDDKDSSNDSKEDDNDIYQRNHEEDTSVSLEFHGIENFKNNLDNHRYDILQSSTAAVEIKPTSSPYLPETFSANADNNNVVQEYVEAREKIDSLQEHLLLNKLNMDKDFYDIIANDIDDKNLNKLAEDIAVLRDNAYKIKRSVDDMQDIKSKLYFQNLIKAALRRAQLK